jgi:hypothetical protein
LQSFWKEVTTAKKKTTSQQKRDEQIFQFLQQAKDFGQVGSLRTQEERDSLLSLAKDVIAPLTDRKPARVPLTGIHQLIYSAAPGGSSGKIGPFVGSVTQEFVNDTTFINAVRLGPLQIALRAERQVTSDTTIKVTFRETTVTLFGQEVTRKTIENSGGVWKYLFCGMVTMDNGKQKLIRIMETPSLFVLEQEI